MSLIAPMQWMYLVAQITRVQYQVERVAAITEAPKFFFESGNDDEAAARRVHAKVEKMIAEGQFHLPAPQVLIEDPCFDTFVRRFYLCTHRAADIEIWVATSYFGFIELYRTPMYIPLRTGTSWKLDVDSPTIAVKEFVLAMNDPMAVKIDNGDYTHVAWIKGGVPNTRAGDFEHFIDAIRQGAVSILNPHAKTIGTYIEREPNRWSVPVYDFGPLLNREGDGALDRDLLMGLLEEAPQATLPAPSCVFLFQDHSDPIHGALTKIVRVDGLRNGKPNVTFVAAHVERQLRHADMTLHPGGWSVLDLSDTVGDGQDEDLAEIACRLLAAWRENFEVREVRNYRTAKINKKRLAASQTTIQATQTIHITEQRIIYLREELAARAVAATGRVMPKHTREITDRWIYPRSPGARQFRPYQRKPKSIVVNEGRAPIAAQFRVVP